MECYKKSKYCNFPNLFALGLFHIFPLQSFQSLLAVLNKLHQFLDDQHFKYWHWLVLICVVYPTHKVRLVDPIVPGAVLTEAEKDGVDGHAVNTNEGVGYQVSEQDGYCYLRPEILNLFVFLEK